MNAINVTIRRLGEPWSGTCLPLADRGGRFRQRGRGLLGVDRLVSHVHQVAPDAEDEHAHRGHLLLLLAVPVAEATEDDRRRDDVSDTEILSHGDSFPIRRECGR